MKKRNILQLSEAVGILHVLSASPDLSKINWALSIFPLSGKIYVINFSHLHKLAEICIFIKGPVNFKMLSSCTQHPQRKNFEFLTLKYCQIQIYVGMVLRMHSY